jgi:CIC family chloride channel protein
MLSMDDSLETALVAFERGGHEAIVVVNNTSDRMVRGLVTEAYALRRYAQEFNRRQRRSVGD